MTTFWICVYLAVLCLVMAWLWGKAKDADDEFERDQWQAERQRRLSDLQADFRAQRVHRAMKGDGR